MADLSRIESNIRLMIGKGAPVADIDEYLKQEGYTPESFKAAVQPGAKQPTGPSYTLDSIDVPLEPGENPLRSIGSAAWDMVSRAPRAADDVVRRAANSMTFNFADKAAAGANSLFGGSYSDNIKKERQQTAQAAERLGPVPTLAADVGGGLMTGMGAVRAGLSPMAAYGSRFGTVGKTMLGAAEGGAYGALSGAGGTDNGNVADYLGNMATHGAEGAVVGGLLSGVPGVFKDARDWISKSPEAAQRWAQDVLGKAMAWDRGGQRAKVAALGPEATLGDTGPGMRGVAQGVMTRPGEGASQLATTLEGRRAGRAGRLQDATTESLGSSEPSWFYPGDQNQAKQVLVANRSGGALPNGAGEVPGLNPEYTEVWKNAPKMDAADVEGIVNVIDRKMETAKGPMKAALQYMRSQLVLGKGVPVMISETGVITHVPADKVGPGMVPLAKGIGGKPKDILETNPEALNNAKIALSDLVTHGDTSIGIERGAISKSEGNIKYITALIDDMLKTKVPGYKAVTDKSSQLARQVEAVDQGFDALGGGAKTAVPPRAVAETAASDGGKNANALRVGARARVDAEVGTNPNDLSALNRLLGGDHDWNRAKMETIFGKEATDQLLKSVRREQTFANTENAVLSGSQTAQRTGASQAIDETAASSMAPWTMHGLLNWAGNKLMSAQSSTARQAVRDELGRVMSLKGAALDDFMMNAELAAKQREFQNRMFAQRQYGLLGGEQGLHQPQGLTIDMTR